ncbi:hypothetical protein Tsubulata_044539 [Turnera subulata]|uniref:VQ domain-containing protein n=1 Tax=Turnera subulata TaxID=218843 RepID=A0A9Q0JDB8_9ROSI|nr:hypothetical protein Tsubulata_044539 [Turnera subulata]
MKVKIGASEFRARVQELTGKDSDTTRFMYFNGAQNSPETTLLHNQTLVNQEDQYSPVFPPLNSCHQESTTSSDSALDSCDDVFPLSEGSFMGMLQSGFFSDSSSLDALNWD